MKQPMAFAQWVVATLIAGVTMAIMLISLVTGLFYGRAEGAELKERVDRVESALSHIEDRLDRIYELLKK